VTTPYEVLGINPDAEDVVVESAYRALSKQYHPDAGGDPEKFKEIQEAYEKSSLEKPKQQTEELASLIS